MSNDGKTMTEFKFGDRLTHTGRPEWGTGVVTAAQRVVQGGQAVQRLTLRFERAGLKTIATPPASLCVAVENAQAAPAVEEDSGQETGWLADAERAGTSLAEIFSRLPDACDDPFASLASRIEATLHLYRFDMGGGSLLDWASVQTGLADPLVEFARHDLELHFPRFVQAREGQLRKLLREVRESDTAAVREIVSKAIPAGRDAVKRAYGSR